MHELSLAREMVRILQEQSERENFSSVKRVRMTLGALSCVSPESFRFAFDAVRTGLLEEAELQIDKVPARGQCSNCGEEMEMWHRLEQCGRCGADLLASNGGEEVRISELEVVDGDG